MFCKNSRQFLDACFEKLISPSWEAFYGIRISDVAADIKWYIIAIKRLRKVILTCTHMVALLAWLSSVEDQRSCRGSFRNRFRFRSVYLSATVSLRRLEIKWGGTGTTRMCRSFITTFRVACIRKSRLVTLRRCDDVRRTLISSVASLFVGRSLDTVPSRIM